MNTPRQLKDMNVFGDGQSFLGECKTFTRPKLTERLEEIRMGGLDGVEIPMGLEKLECTHKYGGEMPALNRQFGVGRLDGAQLRFVGAYKNDATGALDDVQVIIRGRHVEIDNGDDESGKASESTYKTSCVYYKQTRNGQVEFEIDKLNNVFIVYGVDRNAELRKIIGG